MIENGGMMAAMNDDHAGVQGEHFMGGIPVGLRGCRSWKSKTAIALGLGVPLAVVALGDPAAADPGADPFSFNVDTAYGNGKTPSASMGNSYGSDHNARDNDENDSLSPQKAAVKAEPDRQLAQIDRKTDRLGVGSSDGKYVSQPLGLGFDVLGKAAEETGTKELLTYELVGDSSAPMTVRTHTVEDRKGFESEILSFKRGDDPTSYGVAGDLVSAITGARNLTAAIKLSPFDYMSYLDPNPGASPLETSIQTIDKYGVARSNAHIVLPSGGEADFVTEQSQLGTSWTYKEPDKAGGWGRRAGGEVGIGSTVFEIREPDGRSGDRAVELAVAYADGGYAVSQQGAFYFENRTPSRDRGRMRRSPDSARPTSGSVLETPLGDKSVEPAETFTRESGQRDTIPNLTDTTVLYQHGPEGAPSVNIEFPDVVITSDFGRSPSVRLANRPGSVSDELSIFAGQTIEAGDTSPVYKMSIGEDRPNGLDHTTTISSDGSLRGSVDLERFRQPTSTLTRSPSGTPIGLSSVPYSPDSAAEPVTIRLDEESDPAGVVSKQTVRAVDGLGRPATFTKTQGNDWRVKD